LPAPYLAVHVWVASSYCFDDGLERHLAVDEPGGQAQEALKVVVRRDVDLRPAIRKAGHADYAVGALAALFDAAPVVADDAAHPGVRVL